MDAVSKPARISPWRHAVIAAAALVLVVLVLAACSSITLFYTFADDAIESEVDDYLDLDDDERVLVGQEVDALMHWHRTEMLPRYATFLRAQAVMIETGEFTREIVDTSYFQVRDLMYATLRGAFAPAASILMRHTGPAKLGHLRRRMTEKMEERVERARHPRADRVERRAKRYVENIERFTGPLSEPQIALIRRHAENTDEDGFTWINYRMLRETAFLKFLAARPSEAEIAAFLDKVLLHAEDIVGPDYRTYRNTGTAKFRELMYRIAIISTPKQRRTAARKLRDYADDFTWLSERMF